MCSWCDDGEPKSQQPHSHLHKILLQAYWLVLELAHTKHISTVGAHQDHPVKYQYCALLSTHSQTFPHCTVLSAYMRRTSCHQYGTLLVDSCDVHPLCGKTAVKCYEKYKFVGWTSFELNGRLDVKLAVLHQKILTYWKLNRSRLQKNQNQMYSGQGYGSICKNASVRRTTSSSLSFSERHGGRASEVST